jgi:hypothetical protein
LKIFDCDQLEVWDFAHVSVLAAVFRPYDEQGCPRQGMPTIEHEMTTISNSLWDEKKFDRIFVRHDVMMDVGVETHTTEIAE